MKYYGKEKCRILKEIRAEIARENGIEWVVSECKHKGNCKGTCPKCEQEVRQLEEALARREALGKKVAVVGISASIALSVTGCVNPFPQTQGDMILEGEPMPPENETACDTAIQGVEIQTEQGELVVPGEPLPETEAVTDEPLMGDVIWEGEPTEEMTEEPLLGAPEEVPTELATEPATEPEETDEETDDETSEETTEPEIVDIMGEPAE